MSRDATENCRHDLAEDKLPGTATIETFLTLREGGWIIADRQRFPSDQLEQSRERFMHRLYFAALTALGALVATAPEAEAQFGFHRGCRFGGGYGYYQAGPPIYAYGPYGYPAYGFSGFSFGGFTAGIATVGPRYYPVLAYPGYPMGYTYIPAAPMPIQDPPMIVGQNPFDNPVLNEWQPQQQREQEFVGQNQRPVAKAPAPQHQFLQPGEQRQVPEVRMPIRQSNAEGRRKAIRALAQGDEAFRLQHWAHAYLKYKEAATFAGDQADPHFRMAVTLAAMNQYGQAADEFKRGLQIDSAWPASAVSLDDLYGDAQILAKQSMLHGVTVWAREDIRDANRSFVIGVLLFLDRDVDRAAQFLQASVRLGGSPAYARAFQKLQPAEGQNGGQLVVPADRNQIGLPPGPGAPQKRPLPPAPIPQLSDPQEPATNVAPTLPAPTPKLESPADGPEIGPLPPAGPPTAAPAKKPGIPRAPTSGSSDGLGPAIPVLPSVPPTSEPRARVDGPQFVVPDEATPKEVAAPLPQREKAREVTFVRPTVQNSATIFRGNRRFEYFPRRRPVADEPTIIEDTFPR